MKAIVVGAGEVGYHLADRLSKEGHDVTIVERNPAREKFLHDKVNASVVLGSGASAEVLEAAGIQKAELFVALTDIDEVNMFACMLAREYNVPHKIARVSNVEYTRGNSKLNAEKLGIELLINPRYVVADEICEMVEYTYAVDAAEFADGRVVFLGYPILEGNPLTGKTLKQLSLTHAEAPMVVTSITRNEKTIIPSGGDKIQQGDVISIVAKKDDLHLVRNLFGFKTQETKTIFVLGAGRVGFEIARRLSHEHRQIKVVDRDTKKCRDMSDKLENVLVLCTDSTDIETLKSEGLGTSDVFIAVTDDDQSNILGSLLAKRHGVKRAITLVNQPELSTLANSLGIDACISPRLSTASAILKYIRRGNVVSMVEQSDAEVLELELSPNSPILEKPIQSIQLPKGVIIGAIVRKSEVIVPSGKDILRSHDRVIVFTLLQSVPKVEKFFS